MRWLRQLFKSKAEKALEVYVKRFEECGRIPTGAVEQVFYTKKNNPQTGMVCWKIAGRLYPLGQVFPKPWEPSDEWVFVQSVSAAECERSGMWRQSPAVETSIRTQSAKPTEAKTREGVTP